MSHPFVSRVGGVVSADVAVPDHDRELRFYSRVLGTGPSPLWRDDLTNNDGSPVIGLGPWQESYGQLPRQWMPHIMVADVAESARRAVEHGGRELMHGKDDAGQSQWAVMVDPHGAGFGLIPVVPADQLPASSAGPVGHIAWLELTVTDAAAARDFYRAVVGWTVEERAVQDADGPYTDFMLRAGDGRPAAGLSHPRAERRDHPSAWMLHLPVGDLAESLRRVEQEGGRTLATTCDSAGRPIYAAVEDLVGVCFGLVGEDAESPSGHDECR